MVPSSLFALNPDSPVEHRTLGDRGHRLVVVDDFYLDPDRVASLANEVEFTSVFDVVRNFPGERSETEADTHHLVEAVCRHYGKTEAPEVPCIPFCVSRFWGDRALEPRQRLPHVDPTLTALVYLNQPDDCSGGTAFYRHRPTGIDFVDFEPDPRLVLFAQAMGYRRSHFEELGYWGVLERLLFNPRFASDAPTPLNEGNDVWELLDLVEMRFNRLIIYDGRIPHSMWVDPDRYRDVPRVNQLLSVSLDGAEPREERA